MKSVLVTGGLGFVGSHLVESLLSEGSRVTIVDNLLSNVVEPDQFAHRCQVLCEGVEDALPRLISKHTQRFDEIYHLASVVGPAGVLQHAGNIAGSVIRTGDATIQLALAHDARLLLASTSEVYGRSGSLGEELDCIVSPKYTVRLEYAAAKLTSEIAAINKARVTSLKVNVVRPFNIAGPRQLPDGGFVLPRFVVAALTGAPLTVFGDGTQIRAFTDVRDIVTGLLAAIRGSQNGEVFNLGNPANEISIGALAKKVIELSGSSSGIELADPKKLFGPLYEEGIERCPNVTKALGQLNWQPQFTLDQTIQDTLDFYRGRTDLLGQETLQSVAT